MKFHHKAHILIAKVFKYCEELQKVTLPEGIEAISYSAFEECCSLKQINLPETLTRIGDYAFAGCSELKSVIMSDNVTELGDGCFSWDIVLIVEKGSCGETYAKA